MMTRDQHLEFCKRCLNRQFDTQQGLVCKLTGRIADFENTCPSFKVDETVKVEPVAPAEQEVKYTPSDLTPEIREAIRMQQDLSYGIIGGLSAAIVGAILWALITYFTHYQIGYMAIAVGLMVGFAVRFFGAGIDMVFGIVGAVFAVLGCAFGNLLSQIGFLAEVESLGYFEVIPLLNWEIISSLYRESFSPMDVFFYAIAAYEGYKFAFRPVTENLINPTAVGKVEPVPFAHLRFPIVASLFVVLSVLAYFAFRGSSVTRTTYYESGNKQYEGLVVNGKEQGLWTYWYDNGSVKQTGYFKDGKTDSVWEYFSEEGARYARRNYRNNLDHGPWEDYFPNGQVRESGQFKYGRLQGPYVMYYEDGTLHQRGFYALDQTDSAWEVFYPDGKPNSRGSFHNGKILGPWTFWFENGQKSLEVKYLESGYMQVLNAWTEKGVQQVKDGSGTYFSYYSNGKVSETGQVMNAERVGIWRQYAEDGKLLEEAEYKNQRYHLINSWTSQGQPMVSKGEGKHVTYYEPGVVRETGMISGGLRTGEWITYQTTGDTLQVAGFVAGKLSGRSIAYHAEGGMASEGMMKEDLWDGEWRWYHANGMLESSVTFVNGRKEGDQVFYDDAGTLLRTEVYGNGKLLETR